MAIQVRRSNKNEDGAYVNYAARHS